MPMTTMWRSVLVLSSAFVAGTSASEGGEVCEEQFNLALFSAVTNDDKCSALAEYSKCLGALSDRDALVHEPRLVSYQQGADCGGYEHTPPVIRTENKDLQFVVDHNQKATFFRHRREEVNVFTMRTDIDELESAFDTAEAARATDSKAIKDSQDTLDAKLTQDVKTANADLLQAMADLEAKLTGDSSTLETDITGKLSKTEKDLTDAMAKLQKDVEADADTFEKGVNAAVDGVSKKVDDLEKDLTAAVDKKIGAIPDPYFMQPWVHWGKKSCPSGHTKWYEGVMYGGHQDHGGTGTLECINNDGKDNGGKSTGTSSLDLLYPAAVDHNHGSDLPRNRIFNCAVCMSPKPCIEARGMKTCPNKYKMQYSGYLIGNHQSHRKSGNRVCVDKSPDSGFGGYDGAWLYVSRVQNGKSNVRGDRSLECGLCCYSP